VVYLHYFGIVFLLLLYSFQSDVSIIAIVYEIIGVTHVLVGRLANLCVTRLGVWFLNYPVYF
jgi:hypothetical protein